MPENIVILADTIDIGKAVIIIIKCYSATGICITHFSGCVHVTCQIERSDILEGSIMHIQV